MEEVQRGAICGSASSGRDARARFALPWSLPRALQLSSRFCFAVIVISLGAKRGSRDGHLIAVFHLDARCCGAGRCRAVRMLVKLQAKVYSHILRNGDRIGLSVSDRRLDLLVSEDEQGWRRQMHRPVASMSRWLYSAPRPMCAPNRSGLPLRLLEESMRRAGLR